MYYCSQHKIHFRGLWVCNGMNGYNTCTHCNVNVLHVSTIGSNRITRVLYMYIVVIHYKHIYNKLTIQLVQHTSFPFLWENHQNSNYLASPHLPPRRTRIALNLLILLLDSGKCPDALVRSPSPLNNTHIVPYVCIYSTDVTH